MTPRLIVAECVDVGDKVSVELPEHDGIVTHRVGRVYRIINDGHVRFLYTVEGGMLFTWHPGLKSEVKVTLLDRRPSDSLAVPLFN